MKCAVIGEDVEPLASPPNDQAVKPAAVGWLCCRVTSATPADWIIVQRSLLPWPFMRRFFLDFGCPPHCCCFCLFFWPDLQSVAAWLSAPHLLQVCSLDESDGQTIPKVDLRHDPELNQVHLFASVFLTPPYLSPWGFFPLPPMPLPFFCGLVAGGGFCWV